jgi:hypothetical protein
MCSNPNQQCCSVLQLGLALFSAALLAGCQSSDRTGEVGLYKVAPVNLSSQPERTSAMFILRERGFSVSENQFRLASVIGDYEGVGLLTIKDALKQIVEDSYRAKRELQSLDQSQSPKARQIDKIYNESESLLKLPVMDDKTRLSQEANLTQLMENLEDTRSFLEDLDFSLQDLRDITEGQRAVKSTDGIFDVMFRVLGRPLRQNADWQREAVSELAKKNWEVDPGDIKRSFTVVDSCLFSNRFSKLITNWVNGVQSGNAQQEEEAKERITDLGDVLFSIVEDSLNLAADLPNLISSSGGNATSPMPGDKQGAIRTAKPPQSRVKKSGEVLLRRTTAKPAIRGYGVDYVFSRIKQNREKANYLISQIFSDVRRQLRHADRGELGKLRVDAERYAEDLAALSQRKLFRKLQPAPEGRPPTHVTFLLRTLYLRHLGSGSQDEPQKQNNDLLVTCGVKQADNADETVYPVIFEQHYAPSFFVNRVDRIIYGPTPYTGQMLDFRITALQLNDLNNQAMTSGFASLTATVGAMNPEFSAFAPAVNALFGTIVKAATQEAMEMDFSFTVPQPEGDGMPDTDFLVAETGHYIVIKAENPARRGISHEAAKRQFYRRLIYNPSDGKLYRREFLYDAKANFREELLFTEQDYAVIVVTDEYTKPDNLGQQLRKQLDRTLGERRAKQIVPDLEQTRQAIDQYRILTGATNTLAPIPGAGFQVAATALKDELWQQISEMRKQFITETLYARADENTRVALGTDPEKWKKAAVTVDGQGIIRLTARTLAPLFVKIPRVQNPICAFSEIQDVTNLQFVIADAQGNVSSNLPNVGVVDAQGCFQPVEFDEKDRLIMSPSVRLLGRKKDSSAVQVEREIIFTGDAFDVTGLLTSGAVTNGLHPGTYQVPVNTNTSYRLELSVLSPNGYTNFEFESVPAVSLSVTNGTNAFAAINNQFFVTQPKSLEITIYPSLFKKLVGQRSAQYVPLKRMRLDFVPQQ